MAEIITCDNGCGRTLAVPIKKAPDGWRRLSINRNGKLRMAHVCPNCPETRVRERLESSI